MITITDGDLAGLELTTSSVFAQQGHSFDYIIVNGGDKILSNEHITAPKGFRGRFTIYNIQDTSLWEGFNNAIDICCAEWAIFMNAGDYFFASDVMLKYSRFLSFESKADVIYAPWYQFTSTGDILGREYKLRKPLALKIIHVRLPFCHQATFTRVAHLKKYRFKQIFAKQKYSLDHAFYLKLYLDGKKFELHDYPICYYQAGGLSDKHRISNIACNLLNSLIISPRYDKACNYLMSQIIIQAGAFARKTISDYSQRIWRKLNFLSGLVIESCRWSHAALTTPKSKCQNIQSKQLKLFSLIQYDAFAYSVFEALTCTGILKPDNCLLASRVFLARNHREVLASNPCVYVEQYLDISKLLLQVVKLAVSENFVPLSLRALSQIDASVLRRHPGLLKSEIRFYDYHRGRALIIYCVISNALSSIYNAIDIEGAFVNDPAYAHNYSFVETSLLHKIPVSYFSFGYDASSIYLKTIQSEPQLTHPVSPQNHELSRQLTHTSSLRRTVAEAYESYMSPHTFHGFRSSWHYPINTESTTNNIFKTTKKIVIIFSHVLFDANGCYGSDLFPSLETWLYNTLYWYKHFAQEDIFVILKEHPGNKYKYNSSTIACSPEMKIFKALGLHLLTSSFGFLGENNPVSPKQIYSEVEGIITVRGTAALEATCFGVPVLLAGSSRFSGHGIGFEPNTRLEYYNCLNNFFRIPNLSKAKRSRSAIYYAYLTLFNSALSIKPYTLRHESGRNPQYHRSF